jgi:hypothetical protein
MMYVDEHGWARMIIKAAPATAAPVFRKYSMAAIRPRHSVQSATVHSSAMAQRHTQLGVR